MVIEEEEFERIYPVVTWTIIAVNVVIFILEIMYPWIIDAYAFVPIDFLKGQRLETLITHMFLHADVLHIFMNMYFCWVFCDDLENVYGHGLFFIFYIFSGIGAAAIHAMLTAMILPDLLDIGCIGASGALFGALAAYAIFFPKRRLYILSVYGVIRVRAWQFALFYFLIETIYVALGVNDYVAHTAHFGGFITGLLLAMIYKVTKKPRIYKTPQHWW